MNRNFIKVSKLKKIDSELRVPGDKSISHRSVIIASLSEGVSKISNYLMSEDCLNTLRAFQALGVKITQTGDREFEVEGKGLNGLKSPSCRLDLGNSGTGLRLLAGVLASQKVEAELIGDHSLSRRPMKRIIDPLTEMGARITARDGNYPPLKIEGTDLRGITYELPVPSAQVKSAVLIAGLNAMGKTVVIEPVKSRNHTELMLKYFGADIKIEPGKITLSGRKKLKAKNVVVPADISSAAFFMVAAAANNGSRLKICDVGLNPTRDGIISILRRMGANIKIEPSDTAISGWDEPRGDIIIEGGELKGTVIEGKEIPIVIDEIPILSVAASIANGLTIIKDATELRVKESDRIKTMVQNLSLLGVDVVELADGMVIQGGRKLKGAVVDSYDDHRVAMSMAILGLYAEGETKICNTKNIDTSFPDFEKILKSLR